MSPQGPGNKCVFHDSVRSAPPPGYFMYIEASLMRPGHKARLLTSDLRGSSSPQCLIFYYNMYGSGMGILSVLLRRGDRERDTLLWRRRGEQSISWMRAMVDYDCDVRHQVRGTQTVCKHIRCPTAVSSVCLVIHTNKTSECKTCKVKICDFKTEHIRANVPDISRCLPLSAGATFPLPRLVIVYHH